MLHRKTDESDLRIQTVANGQPGKDIHHLPKASVVQGVAFAGRAHEVDMLIATVNGILHVPLEHGHVQLKVFGPRQHAGRETPKCCTA